jgi:hypothetical protein
MDEQTVETNFLFLHEERHAVVLPRLLALSDDPPRG